MTGLLTATQRVDLHARTLRVLVASQVLGGLGPAAGITVGASLAEDVLGSASLAGLPAARRCMVGRSRSSSCSPHCARRSSQQRVCAARHLSGAPAAGRCQRP